MRPQLLLDVDGVLNPTGGGVPPGFERTMINGYEMTWSPQHRDWLKDLASLCDLVWATTWEHHANQALSPLLGLPQLPVIEFGRPSDADTKKLPAVRQWVGDNPFAWIDDHLYPDAFEWAAEHTSPALLIRPASSIGMTEVHVDELRSFASSLAGES